MEPFLSLVLFWEPPKGGGYLATLPTGRCSDFLPVLSIGTPGQGRVYSAVLPELGPLQISSLCRALG